MLIQASATSGIIFDVFECLVQRNFSYATADVREAYKTLKECLYDPHYSKVVFIMHSQGGIEGSLVLDWVLQELPQDLLAKLEVYTFGCASNHFNNPHRRVNSQTAELNHLSSMATTSISLTDTLSHSPVEIRTPAKLSQHHHVTNGDFSHPAQTTPTTSSLPEKPHHIQPAPVPPSDRAIGHIEHYAHTTDFVAIWGVLHFVTNGRASPSLPRFIGRVFSRTSPRGGHQFCQHYLDGMFPLEKDSYGNFLRCKDTNDFMESVVSRGVEGSEGLEEIEGEKNSWGMIELAGKDGEGKIVKREVEVHGSFTEGGFGTGDGTVKVKDLSRLWLYRNGRSPSDVPVGLRLDVNGAVRAGTL
jgi:hypothetical protein